MKRNKKQKLRGECDKLWYNKYLKPECEVCGENYYLQGHHFYFKSSNAHLRFTPENHITLCKKCHFRLHFQDPKLVEEIIIKNRGEKWLKKLKSIKRPKFFQQTISWYNKQIELLK